MRIKFKIPVLASMFAAAITPMAPALAQAAPSPARCFLVSNMFSTSTNETAKQLAVQSSLFYLGRLTGTEAQILAALTAERRTITQQNAPATMQACARTLQQRAAQLRGIAQQMSQGTRK